MIIKEKFNTIINNKEYNTLLEDQSIDNIKAFFNKYWNDLVKIVRIGRMFEFCMDSSDNRKLIELEFPMQFAKYI